MKKAVLFCMNCGEVLGKAICHREGCNNELEFPSSGDILGHHSVALCVKCNKYSVAFMDFPPCPNCGSKRHLLFKPEQK